MFRHSWADPSSGRRPQCGNHHPHRPRHGTGALSQEIVFFQEAKPTNSYLAKIDDQLDINRTVFWFCLQKYVFKCENISITDLFPHSVTCSLSRSRNLNRSLRQHGSASLSLICLNIYMLWQWVNVSRTPTRHPFPTVRLSIFIKYDDMLSFVIDGKSSENNM